jgi:hypothetical protein
MHSQSRARTRRFRVNLMVRRYSMLVLLAACGGGAGSAIPERARSARVGVEAEPVEADVEVERVGAAVRLDISAIGRGVDEGAEFEDPDRWRISARQGGRSLDRLVNGSVAIDRRPAGQVQWDTHVSFNVTYELTGREPILVRVDPPGGPLVERTFPP